MINLEEGMSPQDLNQWLREGFFYFRLSKDAPKTQHIGTLLHVKENPADSHVVESLGGQRLTTPEDLYGFVFPHWPDLGSINVPSLKTAVHLRRIQLKQWKRTYNTRQIKLIIPRKWDLIRANPELRTLRPTLASVVQSAFEPEYPDIVEAKEQLRSGWTAVALSPTVIIVNTAPKMVFFRGKSCALLHRGEQTEVIDRRACARVERQFPGGFNL